MNDINKRIKTIRKSVKMNQEQFGKKLGVTAAAISRIENGERNTTEQMMRAICREFNIEFLWLTTGEGNMFANSEEYTKSVIDTILSGESDFQKNIFKTFAKFSSDDWANLEKIIDLFHSTEKK